MNKLREAAQQALVWIHYTRRVQGIDEPAEERALRAALAEPQEPCNPSCAPGYCYCEPVQEPVQEPIGVWRTLVQVHADGTETWKEEPVFSAPPQRKPLSKVEIYKAYETALGKKLPNMGASRTELIAITRAVEAAHGIKEGT